MEVRVATTDWNRIFEGWAGPPGDDERERIDRAVKAVRDALDADDGLRSVTRVFVHGSYRNSVNVRADTDVDLGVLYTGHSFFAEYPPGTTRADFGNVEGDKNYSEFKDALGGALERHLGSAVLRGSKAFDIKENCYRVDADVAPFFVHRRYSSYRSFICGVEMWSDGQDRIVNWPERLFDEPHWPDQHYENGVAKNTETHHRYKSVVRIIKSLRNHLEETGSAEAKQISGFFVECLVFNVPSHLFGGNEWESTVQNALSWLWEATASDDACMGWREVSKWKYLFKGLSGKRQQAHAFLEMARAYVGSR
jgi:hypothetical protein